MKFREHRGQLADSMQTCVELPDREALVEHLHRILSSPPLPFEELTVEPYDEKPDARIGWQQTYIVKLKWYGVIGFTDGPAYRRGTTAP